MVQELLVDDPLQSFQFLGGTEIIVGLKHRTFVTIG